MMAIAYFFSSQKLSLLSTEYQDDPTLQKLYSIAKEYAETKILEEKLMSEVLLEICNQTNLQFKKEKLNTLKPMPETVLTKRLRAYADDWRCVYRELQTNVYKQLRCARGAYATTTKIS